MRSTGRGHSCQVHGTHPQAAIGTSFRADGEGQEGAIHIAEKEGEEDPTEVDAGLNEAQRALARERAVIRAHQRLGHLNFQTIAHLIGLGVPGVQHLSKSAALRLVGREERCDACAVANLRSHSFGHSKSHATRPGDLCHIDITGPHVGNQEYAYSLNILDDHSRRLWVYPISDRSSATVSKILQQWHRLVANYLGRKVLTVHTDNGTEFDNAAMSTWAAGEGIAWKWTIPGSSEQNGRVERVQGVLQERGRAMLAAARLPVGFWPFAWRYAAYIINRTPHRSLGLKIPEHLWTGKPVDLTLMRTFGCLCWTIQDARHRPDGKLSARGVRGTFLGIPEDRKGWLVYVPSDTVHPLRYSRSVLFDETRTYDEGQSLDIPQRHQSRDDQQVEMVLSLPKRRRRRVVEGEETLAVPNDLINDELGDHDRADVQLETMPVPETNTLDHQPSTEVHDVQLVPETNTLDHQPSTEVHDQAEITDEEQATLVPHGPLGDEDPVSEAETVDPRDPRQVEAVDPHSEESGKLMAKPKKREKHKDPKEKGTRRSPRLHDTAPLGASLHVEDVDGDHVHVALMAIAECSDVEGAALLAANGKEARTLDGHLLEPTTFAEALSREDREQWKASMNEEYKSLIEMRTWELCHPPPGRKLIGCRWVYKVKLDPEGRATRWKSRLVAQGFSQVEGIDFNETFAPVARLSALRMLVTIAIQYRLILWSMDVKTAYLNGELDVDIYMKQPPGYDDGSGRACKLLRTLYGLKQSGRYWYHVLRKRLIDAGFIQLQSEPCVFYRWTAQGPIIILVYVDDVAIAAPTQAQIDETKAQFTRWFKMTDNGPLTSMLGIRVQRSQCGRVATMAQTGYIDQLLQRYGMANCNAATTPMAESSKTLGPREGGSASKEERHQYAALVGSLLWLAQGTRPDIAYAVGKLARYMANPAEEHTVAAKRVLRYLAGTRELCLRFRHTEMEQLIGYSDSDHAADPTTRRSVSGYIFYLHGNPVTWRSRLQDTVSVSSTEAEYVALSEATREALWAIQLLAELKLREEGAVPIYTDNTGAEALSRNPQAHQRTKHIGVHHHLVRENNENGTIEVRRVHTDANPADLLTKTVTYARLTSGREQLGLGTAALVAEVDIIMRAMELETERGH